MQWSGATTTQWNRSPESIKARADAAAAEKSMAELDAKLISDLLELGFEKFKADIVGTGRWITTPCDQPDSLCIQVRKQKVGTTPTMEIPVHVEVQGGS